LLRDPYPLFLESLISEGYGVSMGKERVGERCRTQSKPIYGVD